MTSCLVAALSRGASSCWHPLAALLRLRCLQLSLVVLALDCHSIAGLHYPVNDAVLNGLLGREISVAADVLSHNLLVLACITRQNPRSEPVEVARKHSCIS